ncbi:flagellar biosynthesis protein FlhF [Herbinix luporum]|uniref:flagellar biosynthesis protein FlhF n=1 Tax=Herbinix luporum TaxID=1679721 RepID=UPI001759140E|nr:flagellar biosynthesis protein FlhF [Herbinix luporum]HHT57011.1 flagellar biosynthesis protein FlhF [Herbinix luporum]
MIIKKFQANTETDAIMLAKEELGKDAIVMNIKTISPKGIYRLFRKPLVEITAAIDDTSTYKNDKTAQVKKQKFPDIIYDASQVETVTKQSDLQTSKMYGTRETSAIEEKLNNLQSLLEKQMLENEENNKEDNSPLNKNLTCIQLIYNQLVRNEVDEKYANQIISEIEGTLKRDASMDNILSSIYQKIVLKLGQPKTINIEQDRPKFIFFIGPTGVGKTTTIAKIASKFKIEKKAKVAFITADTYRIAAVEQLRTYANILGIPLKVVYNVDELENSKEEFADYDIIFVDTAGRSHKNENQRQDIERLVDTIAENEREIYLVLSATTKYRDLVSITEAYSEIANYNLIFTKLDETNCVGNIFNIKMLTNAPLSYATFGQDVPDDIDQIDPQSIAKQLLRGQ